MKKLIGSIIVLFLGLMSQPVMALDTNNFYFKDFTADYYLSRDDEGVSHLKVVENFTAVFPNFNQNKGIYRQIPFTNKNGENVTMSYLNKSDIKVLRNGEPEPIYSIEMDDKFYTVSTGNDNYVLGEQIYTFEYEFENAVTDFESYQELYWDTNGTGWRQKFDKVTARLHFVGDVQTSYTGKKWCYVGAYGDSGKDRCTINEISDGVEFTTENLATKENLTFDVELKPGSFVIKEPEKSYALVLLVVAIVIICLLCLLPSFREYLKARGKRKYYKGIFVKPEYQPHSEYDLTEMTELYLGKKKDVRVGMILDLIVKHKIGIIREDGLLRDKWKIKVNSLNGISSEEMLLLEMLNGGKEPSKDEEFKLKTHTVTSSLISIEKKFENGILARLKRDSLVDTDYKIGINRTGGIVGNLIGNLLISVPILMMIAVTLYGSIDDLFGISSRVHKMLVFREYFFITVLVLIVLSVILWTIFSRVARKYSYYQNAGFEAARYMDGLKLYIQMAEADRLKFLQSVKGADTSVDGVVKLYEKLLPYAAIFGLEESWMNELKEYCKLEEVTEPDWLMTRMTASQISSFSRSAANIARNSTGTGSVSIGGGSSSSGFSGGGGGGFSGGGGGGGGGGGR